MVRAEEKKKKIQTEWALYPALKWGPPDLKPGCLQLVLIFPQLFIDFMFRTVVINLLAPELIFF